MITWKRYRRVILDRSLIGNDEQFVKPLEISQDCGREKDISKRYFWRMPKADINILSRLNYQLDRRQINKLLEINNKSVAKLSREPIRVESSLESMWAHS